MVTQRFVLVAQVLDAFVVGERLDETDLAFAGGGHDPAPGVAQATAAGDVAVDAGAVGADRGVVGDADGWRGWRAGGAALPAAVFRVLG
jgi:hypothetical protein